MVPVTVLYSLEEGIHSLLNLLLLHEEEQHRRGHFFFIQHLYCNPFYSHKQTTCIDFLTHLCYSMIKQREECEVRDAYN